MVRRIRTSLHALACLLVLAAPGLARADLLTVDGGWKDFNWGVNGLYIVEGAYKFTTAAPVTLKVTDAFVSGDRFEIYNNGSLLGSTSVPVNDATYVAKADVAYGHPKFSWGEFLLGP